MSSGKPGYYEIETIDPKNPAGRRINVFLPLDLAIKFLKTRRTRYMNLTCAKQVLNNPQRIFEGIREYEQGGWCYAGKPTEWYVGDVAEVPFPDGLVFAVYVNRRLEVYHWRAEKCDRDDRFCPIDWRTRYGGGMIWPITS
jgi:hypothetical protein